MSESYPKREYNFYVGFDENGVPYPKTHKSLDNKVNESEWIGLPETSLMDEDKKFSRIHVARSRKLTIEEQKILIEKLQMLPHIEGDQPFKQNDDVEFSGLKFILKNKEKTEYVELDDGYAMHDYFTISIP